MNAPQDWVSFWDGAHSIYVNEAHFHAHYRDIADAIIRLVPDASATVMDFGCGEATQADRVAARCGALYLCESAGSVRERLRARFAKVSNLTVCAPEDLAALPAAQFDLIVANSVAQYISPADLDGLLGSFRRLLRENGTLVLADIVPPDAGLFADVAALLRYAAANGFFFAALGGLARTAVSPYRRLRQQLGITTYTAEAIMAKLTAAGFQAAPLGYNFEHNPARLSFRASVPARG